MDIPVFVASGNEAFSNGIAFPACTAEAISVGGSYDQDLGTVSWCGTPTCSPYLCTDVSPDEDDFVCHTNSGSLLDFVAPDWRTTTTTMGGGFGNFGGTSAASPYAAGMAALLIQADPTLGVEDIRTLLAMDAPMVSNPANGLSFPRARVDRALASVNVLCGDGFIDPGETCDDGNILAGDCCDSLCQSEPQGGACEDGDACTSGKTCDISGVCQGGSTLTCDDGNLCTTDSCDSASGCVFQNNDVACDDGNACTVLNICSGGFCAAGIPVSCDDAEPCTDDSCDPGSGCVFTNNSAPCDDLSACTSDDACSAGVCEGGPELDCDDGIYCTADSCDELTGCAHAHIADCTPPVVTPGLSPFGIALLTLSMMGMAIRLFHSRSTDA
jgi:cysteine-rich repeat protein